MGEVEEEATYVWSHKIRLGFFFSAMRHFRDELKKKKNLPLDYQELAKRASKNEHRSFRELISAQINRHHPEKLVVTQPGDYRVLHTLRSVCGEEKVELEVRSDSHFLSTPEEFEDWAEGKKGLTMEYFYRTLRKKHDLLMDEDGKPVGGEWNFDQENRETFGKAGPSNLPVPPDFQVDDLTQEVMEMVEARFADHPGNLEHFNLPVTRKQSLYLVRHFTENCLEHFGKYQDALWTGEPFLYHSRLSAPLNVKLIHPREVLDRALDAAQENDIPLNSLEGFVRQVLGWREFIRGVYWMKMPEYGSLNALDHNEEVPSFYWDGETDMECVRDSMKQVLDHGYAHHIQRLMVLGLFALLYGVDPKKFHDWHMAMYVDAIDWVSMPNALGMSQYGDGGIVGSKPYCASANYINKMSNYCRNCPYDHKKTIGEKACPFNAFYWDFLDRHEPQFQDNNRMKFQIKNLNKKSKSDLEEIHERAEELRLKIRKKKKV